MEFLGPDDVPSVGRGADEGPRAIHRIRLNAPQGADALLVRLYFDDLPNSGPVVSAWDELGNRLWASQRLGDGVSLGNAKSVSVPANGLDYIEIEVPGDGTVLRQRLSQLDGPRTGAQPDRRAPGTHRD